MSNEDKKEITMREKETISKTDGEPTQAGICYSPTVDIYETEDAVTVLADLPGVDKEHLDINVEDRTLTITGLVKEETSGLNPLYSEYGVGGYSRHFRLGDTVDQARISASLNDGVLSLVLPKADTLKPRKVEITT